MSKSTAHGSPPGEAFSRSNRPEMPENRAGKGRTKPKSKEKQEESKERSSREGNHSCPPGGRPGAPPTRSPRGRLHGPAGRSEAPLPSCRRGASPLRPWKTRAELPSGRLWREARCGRCLARRPARTATAPQPLPGSPGSSPARAFQNTPKLPWWNRLARYSGHCGML